MLTCQRDLFSLPEDEHYINCAYMGPLMKSVEAAGVEGVRRKVVPRVITPPDFYTEVEILRERFAALVNASPERVALIPAVSYGVAIAYHNTPVTRGKNVVLPGEEFPSNVYAWMDRCAEVGAELRFVDRPEDVQSVSKAWSTRMLEAIDDDTALVTLTSAHWTDGTLFDMKAIGARAKEVGALYVVDGTQSVGALPFDFQAVQPDLLVCAGYKFLLGPYQMSLAVLGDRLIEGQPIERTWIGRENSEDFAHLIDYRTGFRPGARRFDVGEHSNPVTVPMLNESLRQILAWGPENIQGYCESLVEVFADALGDQGAISIAPPEDRGAHLFGVRVADPETVPVIMEALAARKVFVSQRGTSVRASPNVYNTPENMGALAEALKAAVA